MARLIAYKRPPMNLEINDLKRTEDQRFMRDALALGWRQQGLTSPNPAVGAVLVRNDGNGPIIVGRGATQRGGRPHGEPVAIAMAGEKARGATLYVTLEPCSHHGRAGPCADAIITAGIARVVASIQDPDQRVAGQGHARLRAAGVAVDTGILAQEALRAHRGHILRVTKGRPMVTLKIARTKDGFASHDGPGRLLITGRAANNQVHLMRMHADAILVGIGTVIADDPLLTVRLPGLCGRSPIRVVIDSHLRISFDRELITTAHKRPTWIICTDAVAPARVKLFEDAGIAIIKVGSEKNGRVSLPAALQALAQRGIARVFAEGGPTLAEALALDDLIDEAVIITGPSSLKETMGVNADGLQAIGQGLAGILSDPLKFNSFERGYWSADQFEKFERYF